MISLLLRINLHSESLYTRTPVVLVCFCKWPKICSVLSNTPYQNIQQLFVHILRILLESCSLWFLIWRQYGSGWYHSTVLNDTIMKKAESWFGWKLSPWCVWNKVIPKHHGALEWCSVVLAMLWNKVIFSLYLERDCYK